MIQYLDSDAISIADAIGTLENLAAILDRFRQQKVAVVGDFFLDKYLVIDADLDEPSLETGLVAFQVAEVRNSPGAAGTVVNNLVALEAGKVSAFGIIGDDGHGHELRAALVNQGVDVSSLLTEPRIFTPTYMKPVRRSADGDETELSRMDVLNRRHAVGDLGKRVAEELARRIDEFDAVVVVDQVSTEVVGVVDETLRNTLAELGRLKPNKFILVDSRFNIGAFTDVCLKPNIDEARRALGSEATDVAELAGSLAKRVGRDVFLTCGADGVVAADSNNCKRVAGVAVVGPIDPTGAGDATSAAIALAKGSGAANLHAAAIGNLVASITVQQLRTTGVATRQRILSRFNEVSNAR